MQPYVAIKEEKNLSKVELNSSASTTLISNQDEKEKSKKETDFVNLTAKDIAFLFVGLVLACFLAGLDGTIISTALPRIASDFSALDQYSWVVNAYLLTYNACQPLYGKFSDIFGRKNTLVFAVLVFLGGSAGCGASNSMDLLLFFRAIAGTGGAGIISLVLIIISDIFPLEERPKYQAIIWATFGLSSVLGPLLGGTFVDHLSWRWDFYMNLPLGAITIAATTFFLRLSFKSTTLRDKLARIDYLGSIFIVMCVITFLLPTSWGGISYAWNSIPVISLYCSSAVFLAIFIFIEFRIAVEPIVPGHIFKSLTVCAVFITNFFTGAAFFSVIFYGPLYYQAIHGQSATSSGFNLLPLTLGLVIFSMLTGMMVTKVPGGYRTFIWFGKVLIVVGEGLLCTLDQNTSVVKQVFYLLIIGIGLGFELQMCLLAVQSASAEKDMAIVTALAGFFQSIGGGIGVAAASSIFANEIKSNLLNEVSPELLTPQVIDIVENRITDVIILSEPVYSQIIQVYVLSLQSVFRVNTVFAGIALISSLFIGKQKYVDSKESQPHMVA
ncbi:5854_t:CDS:2 [Ambispora leptoticha]|uniref:5854_t:CDS:1 n=1 Tax=Ambispora leptoticha TaxID=144679 RepID=A0A9N9GBT4_9GLOM|nr:5854_t:CDS:2 [Ambispora leptoticha]